MIVSNIFVHRGSMCFFNIHCFNKICWGSRIKLGSYLQVQMKYLNIFAKYILEQLWQNIVLIFVWRRSSCTGLQIHLLEGAIICLAMVFDQCKQMIGFNFGSPYKMMPSIFSTSWHSDSLVFSHVSWHLALIDILGL